jgi:hypothetical protein
MKRHTLWYFLPALAFSSCYPIIQESGQPGSYDTAYNTAPADPGPPVTRPDYPYAVKTSTPGIVISPHTPYNVIDVTGLRPGSLALDTSCNQKFRVP